MCTVVALCIPIRFRSNLNVNGRRIREHISVIQVCCVADVALWSLSLQGSTRWLSHALRGHVVPSQHHAARSPRGGTVSQGLLPHPGALFCVPELSLLFCVSKSYLVKEQRVCQATQRGRGASRHHTHSSSSEHTSGGFNDLFP